MTNLSTISLADLSNVTGGVAVNVAGVNRVVGNDVNSVGVGVRNPNFVNVVPPVRPVTSVPGHVGTGVVDKGHVGFGAVPVQGVVAQ